MEPVRVACVRYLNTVPLVEGLDKVQGLTLVPAVPSHIVDMVHRGEADIGLASIIDCVGTDGAGDAAQVKPPLTLLPAGMIGCDGPTLTVRVFSADPIEQIQTVHADTDSHTSVALAQVVLHGLHGLRPRIVSYHARERMAIGAGALPQKTAAMEEAWPRTVLLIGDKVVNDAPPAERYPHQLDLGEAWKRLTGLPFVYAMWMCRAEEADTPRIRTAAALLDRQRRHNATRLDWIVEKRAPAAAWPVELAQHYLGSLLRYEVGEPQRAAVVEFLKRSAALGLIRSSTPTFAW